MRNWKKICFSNAVSFAGTYVSFIFYCNQFNSIYNKDIARFLEFLNLDNFILVFNNHFPSYRAGGSQYALYQKVLNFFKNLCWQDEGFFVLFSVSQVFIPGVGTVFIIKPNLIFAMVFLVTRHYVIHELEISTLRGKDISDVKLDSYYILIGDLLFRPISLKRWTDVTKGLIISKGVPSFIVDLFFHFFVVDINKTIKRRSSKKILSYDSNRHSWYLSSK